MLTLTVELAKELIASGKEAIARMQAQIDSGMNFHLQTRNNNYSDRSLDELYELAFQFIQQIQGK